MRHYQRGIATLIILVLFLVAGVALVSSVFIFSNQQKISAVKSFAECAKLYPVLESYPAQCNTPDGRHFVQELSVEEKQKLVPPTEPSVILDETETWKTYVNNKFSFLIKYPSSLEMHEVDATEAKQGFDPSNKIEGAFGFLGNSQTAAWGFYITEESIQEVINRDDKEIASRLRLIKIKENTSENINGNNWFKLVWLSDYGDREGVDYLINNGKVTVVLNCGPEADLKLCRKTLETFKFLKLAQI